MRAALRNQSIDRLDVGGGHCGDETNAIARFFRILLVS
jgi:hypothetical protein